MPTERLSMRHIREVLRLHYSVGMSQRAVARSLGLAQGTVSKYLNRARRAGLTWPLPPELDGEVQLENRLFPPPSDRPSDERPHPDWALVHRELRRPNVTLMLLWEEYCRRKLRLLQLCVVLRTLQGVGRPPQADPAPAPRRRREAVRRLFRPHHGGG
ncbi:hypothetical protein ACVWZV_004434 [Bradyrhizobium sp. GM5.1]